MKTQELLNSTGIAIKQLNALLVDLDGQYPGSKEYVGSEEVPDDLATIIINGVKAHRQAHQQPQPHQPQQSVGGAAAQGTLAQAKEINAQLQEATSKRTQSALHNAVQIGAEEGAMLAMSRQVATALSYHESMQSFFSSWEDAQRRTLAQGFTNNPINGMLAQHGLIHSQPILTEAYRASEDSLKRRPRLAPSDWMSSESGQQ